MFHVDGVRFTHKDIFFFAVGVGPGDHAIVYDFSFHVVRLQTGCGCGHG